MAGDGTYQRPTRVAYRPPMNDVQAALSGLGMVGASAALEGVLRWLVKAAQLKSPVVIEGEPGVGKQLAARALHALSPNRSSRVVVLNAGGLTSSELLEVLENEAKAEVPGTVILRRVEALEPR